MSAERAEFDLAGADLAMRIADFDLAPLEPDDAADLFRHFADPRVVEFMDIDPLTDIAEALRITRWARTLRERGQGLRWSIRAADGGAFIGTCGFNSLTFERGRRGEIAYDLGYPWWGKGVIAQVMPALIAFGVERLDLRRLEAMVTPGNARSCRLLERNGFAREGVLRDYGFWKGAFWDQIVYARLAPTA